MRGKSRLVVNGESDSLGIDSDVCVGLFAVAARPLRGRAVHCRPGE